jgi:hypothetical protein
MECVGYDNTFQLELCDKFPLWVPPSKQKPQGSRNYSAKKSSATSPRKRKRKPEENSNLDVDLKDENESESGAADWQEPKFDSEHEDDIQELTYIPRGTRSRPICL